MNHQRTRLELGWVLAERAHGDLVIAHRLDDAAEGAADHQVDQQQRAGVDRKQQQHDPQVPGLRRRPAGEQTGNAWQAMHAARQPLLGLQDHAYGFREPQGHDGQVVAAQPQRDHAQRIGRQRGERSGRRHGYRHRHAFQRQQR
ncbi:hypothetical protein G6F31_018675 [Rhizopus arrhizus]|nr:hypothetical protein G6F31_018675 [Rhizopus arrhizus]